ncbi:MAG TPA: pentapeptide repeat-containing protein [Ktedonobacteraceae bacterium]
MRKITHLWGWQRQELDALNKQKLAQEVQQLKNQNEPDPFGWLRTNASVLLSTLLVVGGGIFTFLRYLAERRDSQKRLLEDRQAERERRDEEQKRWLEDREAEREKRVEERFQAAVTGLGDEKEGARIGAAILLKTFLRPGYERFYTQIFQLVAVNLGLPRTPNPPEDPAASLPLTALRHALMMTFMEAFPLARDKEKKTVGTKLADNEFKVRSTHPAPVTISPTEIHSLKAVDILLDNGFLWYADLKQAWMAQASLRKTDLTGADLSEASLYYSVDLQGATLRKANRSGARLQQVDLRGGHSSRGQSEWNNP